MKISKNRYIQVFCLIVILLGIIRAAVPRLAMTTEERKVSDSIQFVNDSVQHVKDSSQRVQDSIEHVKDSIQRVQDSLQAVSKKNLNDNQQPDVTKPQPVIQSRFFNSDGTPARHRIVSVKSYADAFPDVQEVQIISANKWGVSPVLNRAEAESRKSELVYVGSNPYFFIEPLYWSIPYLVPHALVLLQDIGRNFLDSLQVKGIPSHKIIVTSVMRTKEEVERMRHYNRNVSENSCHMYGTTVDIAYNRYLRVEEDRPYDKQNTVADVRLKQVLSEVLNDLRRQGRCWVKYEVKQSCFHITVR